MAEIINIDHEYESGDLDDFDSTALSDGDLSSEPICFIDCGCTPGFDRLVVDCVNLPPGGEVRAKMPDGTWETRSIRVVEPGSGIGVVELYDGEELESVTVDEDAAGTPDYCTVRIRLVEAER